MSVLSDSLSPTVGEWASRHHVIPEALPFQSRATPRLEIARQLHESVTGLPKTASTFIPRNEIEADIGPGEWLDTLVLMTGAWPHPEHDQRWINPDYCHLDALPTLAVDRELHLRRCAELGVLRIADVAPRFGITTESLRTWISRKGFEWQALRMDGIRRFARTLQTAIQWGEREQDVAGCWPRKRGTVRAQIQKFARDEEFDAPTDPTVNGHLTDGGR